MFWLDLRVAGAIGGAIIDGSSAVYIALGGLKTATLIWGTTAIQSFAIGALAMNTTAFVIAPLVGIEMDGVEYEETQPVYTPPANNFR